ncbi:MAG: hypothetical protein LJE70_07620 [Chromatiaceae bacterium]|nr:hypothetical protein [Chromatiaceae bacterium]
METSSASGAKPYLRPSAATYAYMAPWMATCDPTMDVYRDTMRQLYRRQRDYSQLHRDAWVNAMHPWSKPQPDWSRMRSYLVQMLPISSGSTGSR